MRCKPNHKPQGKPTHGFTLIELLVVIAIIALLLGILMPALQRARVLASSVNCMANVRNLSIGWYNYQLDNNGRIMSAGKRRQDDRGTNIGWIYRPHYRGRYPSWNDPPNPRWTQEVWDEAAINGIRDGLLYDYLDDYQVYHCPGDRRESVFSGINPYVSYAIPSSLYAWTDPGHSMYDQQIRRFDEISRPSERYIFVESGQQRNFTMGGWFSLGAPEYTGSTDDWRWWDPMAVNHGDSGVLGFADGHAETRRWVNRFTIERADMLDHETDHYGTQAPPEGMDCEDLKYMARGWPYRHRGQ